MWPRRRCISLLSHPRLQFWLRGGGLQLFATRGWVSGLVSAFPETAFSILTPAPHFCCVSRLGAYTGRRSGFCGGTGKITVSSFIRILPEPQGAQANDENIYPIRIISQTLIDGGAGERGGGVSEKRGEVEG